MIWGYQLFLETPNSTIKNECLEFPKLMLGAIGGVFHEYHHFLKREGFWNIIRLKGVKTGGDMLLGGGSIKYSLFDKFVTLFGEDSDFA